MLFKKNVLAVLTGAVTLAVSQLATAHTGYVVPFSFDADRNQVTLQSSFTHDFFVPEYGVEAEFNAVDPKGQSAKVEINTKFKEVTILEVPTPEKGTYRIGTQSERKSKQAQWTDGKWYALRPAPQGAAATTPASNENRRFVTENELTPKTKVIETTSIGKMETFVTRGAPSKEALKTTGKGFELDFITHPNEIFLDQPLEFTILINGKPTSGVKFSIYRSGGKSSHEQASTLQATSDAKGKVKIKFDKTGSYILESSYPATSDDKTVTPAKERYSYTLTIAVNP